MRLLTNYQMKFKLQGLLKKEKDFSLLGLDLGTQQAGIALAEWPFQKVQALQVYRNNRNSRSLDENPKFFSTMESIVRSQNVKGLIYGFTPENIDTNDYMDSLVSKIKGDLMITKVDETATTAASRKILKQIEDDSPRKGQRIGHDKDLQDQIASMLILQIFLDQMPDK